MPHLIKTLLISILVGLIATLVTWYVIYFIHSKYDIVWMSVEFVIVAWLVQRYQRIPEIDFHETTVFQFTKPK